ncbi:MAG TPA: methyltransferase domain-containing protein [Bryobacteraceae bacterium]|nr:methyltransferase domain-containing protein [Bryobacteraceae bacterium]
MNTRSNSRNRFENEANKYAAYLETPEGRLRTDLAFANLQEFLPALPALGSLRALDLGCGTGAAGMRLARLGIQVTLLDSSPAMLSLAGRAIAEADLQATTTIQYGDAARLTDIFQEKSFDVILCHNLLEFVDDPAAVFQGAARIMRDSSAILSVLVRNRAGEVLKAALQTGNLAAAEDHLTAEWGEESLYRGKVRLFTSETLESMLQEASLSIVARRGVRVIADYLPAQISRAAEFDRIVALERKLAREREFFAIARYLHSFARLCGGDE